MCCLTIMSTNFIVFQGFIHCVYRNKGLECVCFIINRYSLDSLSIIVCLETAPLSGIPLTSMAGTVRNPCFSASLMFVSILSSFTVSSGRSLDISDTCRLTATHLGQSGIVNSTMSGSGIMRFLLRRRFIWLPKWLKPGYR